MGFLDKFGKGGGKVEVTVQDTVVPAGGAVKGIIKFTGGKREQKITKLTVVLSGAGGASINLAQGGAWTEDEDTGGYEPVMGKEMAVTGSFTAEPGNVYEFPFELPIAENAVKCSRAVINGQPTDVMQWYAVWGSADIPGEIDPHGKGGRFEITGGMKVEITAG